jgi:isoquinoline 1-oxidoreductase beta subunit
VQGNFVEHVLPRMNEVPLVETHIVKSAAMPTGVGEPGVPPVAPAIANALYALTGQRLRSLPLTLA